MKSIAIRVLFSTALRQYLLTLLCMALFFWIPSFLLFAVGCYFIVPLTIKPLLFSDEFIAGQLYVDSVSFRGGADGGRPTMYSIGHIISENNNQRSFELTVGKKEINPIDAYAEMKFLAFSNFLLYLLTVPKRQENGKTNKR